MGAVTSRPQCLPASLVTKMSVALYLFSSRDLVFIGSGLKICETSRSQCLLAKNITGLKLILYFSFATLNQFTKSLLTKNCDSERIRNSFEVLKDSFLFIDFAC